MYSQDFYVEPKFGLPMDRILAHGVLLLTTLQCGSKLQTSTILPLSSFCLLK